MLIYYTFKIIVNDQLCYFEGKIYQVLVSIRVVLDIYLGGCVCVGVCVLAIC
jgi:hypothetical protein